MLSTFGEHLIGEQIESAVTLSADAIGATISEYSVGSLMPEKEGELGGHLYIVEFLETDVSQKKLDKFGKTLDRELIDNNEDYKAHRSEGFGLHAPTIFAVPPGSFTTWMKRRGQLGGQHKVPRIINDRDLFRHLCCHVGHGSA